MNGFALNQFLERELANGESLSSFRLGWRATEAWIIDLAAGSLDQPPLDQTLVSVQLNGRCDVTCKVDGHPPAQAVIARGGVTVVPSGFATRWHLRDPARIVSLLLPPETVEEVVDGLGLPPGSGLRFELGVCDMVVEQLGFALARELEERSEGNPLLAGGIATAMAARLFRRQHRGRPGRRHGPETVRQIRRAVDYLHANLGDSPRLDDLAAEAGLSPHHFARQFKDVVGEAPHQYLSRLRLEKARDLLGASEMPLVEVALECGFSSQARFSTVFSQATGTTPREFRRQARRD